MTMVIGNEVVFVNDQDCHLFLVKEVIRKEHSVQYELALRSGAPVGVYNEDEIRLATLKEQSVGHRLDGE